MRRLAALLSLVVPLAAHAERTCKELLQDTVEHMSLGLSGGYARLDIEITSKRGVVRKRTLEVKSTEEEGLSRTLVRMLAPADVAGTGFLMRENEDGDDDQMIYLPALKRTRRITGSARSRSFMGTDFSYADLEARDLDRTECKLLPEEELEGQPVYLVEARGTGEDETYSRTKMWIHQKTLVPLKVEFYDPKGKLHKVMKVHKIKKKAGRWVSTVTTMENVQKGSSTKIDLTQFDREATFPPETFTERALER